ncbi:MAG TPA: heme exporter protein CcmD [Citreicella sp.]|jgi:heme exporter protein D|uniref:Heme exporter protein D n=2 Tax=Salipiger marinus TaxID=555512 RepID=A0A1G8P1W3_9RHOB|nr:heme exporter protein CcmD [Salipiger manganoxidans]SDI85810.1 heme exporter protein D [Salipiger marinus]HBM58512.1 heme exporter protein CcmD [Citreicella sp.]HBS99725.1 heme exporter protein CcmD [Citreicella sp.]
MMPDLGKYAVAVLGSYGVSLAMIGALVWHSIARARRARAELDKVEARLNRHG